MSKDHGPWTMDPKIKFLTASILELNIQMSTGKKWVGNPFHSLPDPAPRPPPRPPARPPARPGYVSILLETTKPRKRLDQPTPKII